MPKRMREQNRGEECESRKPADIFADFQEAGSYLTEKLLGELDNFYHSHVMIHALKLFSSFIDEIFFTDRWSKLVWRILP